MKEVITTLIFAGIFIATIFFVQSCQPTRQQCDALYPRDINAVNAANAGKMGDEKVAAQKSIDYVKLICVVGCVASIAAIVLGTATLQGLGWSGLAICLASIALIQFYTTWPQWFAYGGGAIALGAGGYGTVSAVDNTTGTVTETNGTSCIYVSNGSTPDTQP